MSDNRQLSWRLGKAHNPTETVPQPGKPPTHSNLAEGFEALRIAKSHHNSSPRFTDRLPRGVSAHSPEQKSAKFQTCNTVRGCNASTLNDQYSSPKSPAPEGFIPTWRLRPGVSYASPIRVAFSVGRWVRLPHPTRGMRQEAAVLLEGMKECHDHNRP